MSYIVHICKKCNVPLFITHHLFPSEESVVQLDEFEPTTFQLSPYITTELHLFQ